jgi:alcohol dehydrogenase (cytochrome c)
MSGKGFALAIATLSALTVSGSVVGAPPGAAAAGGGAPPAGQWVMAGKDHANTRYSELDLINTANAKHLGLAWTFSTGVLKGHEAAPLVVGDTLYVVTPVSQHPLCAGPRAPGRPEVEVRAGPVAVRPGSGLLRRRQPGRRLR